MQHKERRTDVLENAADRGDEGGQQETAEFDSMENSPVYVFLCEFRTETFQTDVLSSLSNANVWLIYTNVVLCSFQPSSSDRTLEPEF